MFDEKFLIYFVSNEELFKVYNVEYVNIYCVD